MIEALSFTRVFVERIDRIWVLAVPENVSEMPVEISSIFLWSGQEEGWAYHVLDERYDFVRGLADPDPALLLASADGVVVERDAVGPVQGVIVPRADGPDAYGLLTDVEVIDGVPYAVGMSRQVYRRSARGIWIADHAGAIQARGDPWPAGFNAVSGRAGNVIAAGFGGEIWRRDDEGWRELTSPTNLALYSIATAPDGRHFVAGQLGILLECLGDTVRIIEQSEFNGNFWRACWFHDALYLCADYDLFRLRGDALERLTVSERETTAGDLHATDELIASCGERHLAISPDGDTWQDITPGAPPEMP